MSRNLLRKLGLILGMLCLLVPLGVGTANATGAYYTASSLPWSASMNVCFGGAICGINDTVTVDVPSSSRIGYVRVYAHDNIGDSHKAYLHLYLDGIEVGAQDVLAAGSYLTFNVSATGSRLVFRSTQTNYTQSDETVLQQIYISN